MKRWTLNVEALTTSKLNSLIRSIQKGKLRGTDVAIMIPNWIATDHQNKPATTLQKKNEGNQAHPNSLFKSEISKKAKFGELKKSQMKIIGTHRKPYRTRGVLQFFQNKRGKPFHYKMVLLYPRKRISIQRNHRNWNWKKHEQHRVLQV